MNFFNPKCFFFWYATKYRLYKVVWDCLSKYSAISFSLIRWFHYFFSCFYKKPNKIMHLNFLLTQKTTLVIATIASSFPCSLQHCSTLFCFRKWRNLVFLQRICLPLQSGNPFQQSGQKNCKLHRIKPNLRNRWCDINILLPVNHK